VSEHENNISSQEYPIIDIIEKIQRFGYDAPCQPKVYRNYYREYEPDRTGMIFLIGLEKTTYNRMVAGAGPIGYVIFRHIIHKEE